MARKKSPGVSEEVLDELFGQWSMFGEFVDEDGVLIEEDVPWKVGKGSDGVKGEVEIEVVRGNVGDGHMQY